MKAEEVDKLGIPLRAEFTKQILMIKVADKLLLGCTKKSCADASYDKRFKKSDGIIRKRNYNST
ncbi:hypothetical protein [Methanothermococcus sp.]|uniref:hypothetical protein n=1 Tax=Methanothermococcus sp. TaxID=2614238 RepID=UPI0025F3BBBC|nr:hypothetical protein [Methanothermococcus sp.]